ncbi:MAG: endonuclease [Erythrobacter sp.]|nr:endonuclease [Erythrobacter sp.]
MKLTFASYNIHKAVGVDRRRDPERIIAVLREVDADVIALQEADLRLGDRASVLPKALLDDTPWRVVPVAKRPRSIGWHGNAILVRRDMAIESGEALDLPTIEPRGAACAVVRHEGARVRIIGTHLDLSGLRRRAQVRALLKFVSECEGDCPTVIAGDFNQWGRSTGAMREFGDRWTLITPGASFPSRKPIARLDRLVASAAFSVIASGAHHTALSAIASDHLPVTATLELPNI